MIMLLILLLQYFNTFNKLILSIHSDKILFGMRTPTKAVPIER